MSEESLKRLLRLQGQAVQMRSVLPRSGSQLLGVSKLVLDSKPTSHHSLSNNALLSRPCTKANHAPSCLPVSRLIVVIAANMYTHLLLKSYTFERTESFACIIYLFATGRAALLPTSNSTDR